MNFQPFLSQTLLQVAHIANQNFGKVSGSIKSGDSNQVLTETDLEIGRHIINEIEKQYPNYNIIDEEAGVIDKGSAFTWVVDPIDGTSNFAAGIPTYGIMIGLLENDTPIAGGIVLPAFNEVYLAEKGKGAFCNGERITVSSQPSLLLGLVAYGIDGHQENPQFTYEECRLLADIVLNIRNLRASNSVFDLVMLAKGKYAGALNRTSKIWDNVAPHILIEEAGGKYTEFFGESINYSYPLGRNEQNFTYCAAPLHLHEQLQVIIHRK